MLIQAKQLTGVLKTDVTVPSNVDQDLGGNQIINLGAPTLGTDAVNKNYVDNLVTASTGLVKVGNDIQLIQTAVSPAVSDASAAVVGVSQEAAHADHKHQVSVGSPVAVGNANAGGAASTLVRSDHVHRAENQQVQVATVNQTQRFNLNFVGSGVSITPTDDLANDRTTLTFTVPAGSSPVKVITNPSAPTTTDNDPTGITLGTATTGATQVTVNGAEQRVQPTAGAPGSFDCFWSTDAGATAVANNNVPSGATLRWRGVTAGFQLATTDVVIVGYNA